MREMKDSGAKWLGKIPTDWKVKRAKYCVTITNGSDPATDGDIPVYGSGANSFKTCGEYKNGPAVLLGRKGTINIPRYIIGQYWNVDTVFDVKTKPFFSLRYYYYLSVVFDYNYYVSQTTLPSMTQTNYYNMVLPCPILDEQRRIAEFLDARCAEIDELTAAIERQIATLGEYRRSVITESVTRGLAPTAPLKDSGVDWLGKIPASWSFPKITHILDYSHTYPIGDGDHGTIKASDYAESGIPFIRVQNLGFATELSLDNIVYITEEQNATIKNSTLQPNDVLFAKTGATIGKVGIIPSSMKKANTTSHVGKITVAEDIDPRFIYYVLGSYVGYKQFWDIAGMKSTRPELSIDETKTIHVTLPGSKAEQSKIAAYLDEKCAEIDTAVAMKQQQLARLAEYKKSLIYEYVTGKREVGV